MRLGGGWMRLGRGRRRLRRGSAAANHEGEQQHAGAHCLWAATVVELAGSENTTRPLESS
jgi:hypothetical protein